MLLNLHVKNIALITDVDMNFEKGFNVLSGETGAGKSLIIDSVNFALGNRVPKDIIRENEEYALCELTFLVEDEELKERIEELGVSPEDDLVILSRKIMNKRGIARINGETVSAGTLKEISSLLIDIHGQHEHQSLLYKSKHLEILDEFLKAELGAYPKELNEAFASYTAVCAELEEALKKEKESGREKELLAYEIKEIEEAGLKEGEDEELEKLYRRMQNSKRILEAVAYAHSECGYDAEASAGSAVGRALYRLRQAEGLDEAVSSLCTQLGDIDSILNDFNRAAADYEQSLEFSAEEFADTEQRLDLINHIKSRYGDTITEVIENLEKKRELLLKYDNYEEYLDGLKKSAEAMKEKVISLSERISGIRKKGAGELSEKIRDALADLNFLDARFEIEVTSDNDHLTRKGFDEVEFLISTNPGEKIRPLTEVASGGELSRIMLALKTVLAGRDRVDTLIFDEIDTGISGRTAQKVSEKLALLSRTNQVICITHLPQIAAMADAHYEIAKRVSNNRTETVVNRLTGENITGELARMISGAEITESVLESAREMKRLAGRIKQDGQEPEKQ